MQGATTLGCPRVLKSRPYSTLLSAGLAGRGKSRSGYRFWVAQRFQRCDNRENLRKPRFYRYVKHDSSARRADWCPSVWRRDTATTAAEAAALPKFKNPAYPAGSRDCDGAPERVRDVRQSPDVWSSSFWRERFAEESPDRSPRNGMLPRTP